MIFRKIKYKIKKTIKLLLWKISYGKKMKIGENINFRDNFLIIIEENGKLEIGNNCFFNNNTTINVLENIKIGNDCIFGENVHIYDHNHRFSKKQKIIEQGFKTDKIEIGNNCWIGTNVVILKGVKIGNNVVIGANCVIKENIEDNTVIQQNNILKKEKIRIK